MEFVALDFETANRSDGGACSVSLIAFDSGGRVLDSFTTLLRPVSPVFDPFMQRVHRLSWQQCCNAAGFDEIWPRIEGMLEGRIAVMHNAGFDISTLKGCLRAYQLTLKEPLRYLCTFQLARKTWDLPRYTLDSMAAYCNLGSFRHHDAYEDARVCAKLFLAECEGSLSSEPSFLQSLNRRGYRLKTLESGKYRS